ncbi:MAG TPA: hypothetical protein VMG12_13160 [Polyangiaceae bacterium]|nr:hypothetical protein [Polyangiaceae bacterium]
MDFEFNPIEIDRVLRRAQHSWLAWAQRDRSLDTEESDEHPLAAYRSVTSQALFRRIGEMPDSDPLREPLRRWVFRLSEQRIDQATLNALASERAKEHRPSDAPGRQAVSFGLMLKRALGDAPRRQQWAKLLLEHAPPVSARSVELWQRRREIARRMGLAHPGEIEAPLPDAASVAEGLSKVTRERVRELGLGSLSALFEAAVGAEVPGAWPARLSPQRLLDFFRDSDLLRSLELRVAPLPSSFGAASTCRALGLLGAGWFEALAPHDQPFVVAHDPYGLGRHQAAALFALLPLNARFARRHLEVSQHGLPDAQRRLAQLWLLDLAGMAFRVRLRQAALASERAFREAFSELANSDLALSLPENAAGAVFELGIEDEQALLGRLTAVARADELIEAHDEDWFRNPRAIEQLRAEARRPPATQADPAHVERSLALVTKRLEQLLR